MRFRPTANSRYTSQAPKFSYFIWQPGPLAQSVEQRTFNPWVVGSIPTGPTQQQPTAMKAHTTPKNQVRARNGYPSRGLDK